MKVVAILFSVVIIGACVGLIAWNVVDIVKSIIKRRKEKKAIQESKDKEVQEK